MAERVSLKRIPFLFAKPPGAEPKGFVITVAELWVRNIIIRQELYELCVS